MKGLSFHGLLGVNDTPGLGSFSKHQVTVTKRKLCPLEKQALKQLRSERREKWKIFNDRNSNFQKKNAILRNEDSNFDPYACFSMVISKVFVSSTVMASLYFYFFSLTSVKSTSHQLPFGTLSLTLNHQGSVGEINEKEDTVKRANLSGSLLSKITTSSSLTEKSNRLNEISNNTRSTQDSEGDLNSIPTNNEAPRNNEKSENSSVKKTPKPVPLSVPLRIVALRGSFPARWIKEFNMAQGRRSRLSVELFSKPEAIAKALVESMEAIKKKKNLGKPVIAADLVSVSDQWLPYLISKGTLTPIFGAENSLWFTSLHPVWQRLMRRNENGEIDPNGSVYAIPYRWGSFQIVMRTDIFEKRGIPPIQSWSDLWRPEFKGKLAFVNSPREAMAVCLKAMGASANVQNIESEVDGGHKAVSEKLKEFHNQVRLYDSSYYLKALSAGDVWVAIGWSSDILPFVQRSTNLAVATPKEGSLLWADFWAIPATHKLETKKLGGRIRGPSPLASQWVDFCLQPARATSFKPETSVGASPFEVNNENLLFSLEESHNADQKGVIKGSEFLEPLTSSAIEQYSSVLSKK